MQKGSAASLKEVNLFSQSTVRIMDKVSGNLIYIDPFQIGSREKTDIILITHPHGDHCDFTSISKLYHPGTAVVVPKECEDAITVVNKKDIVAVEPGMELEIKKVQIKTVPAYNILPDRLHCHPKENKWVGYVLGVNNQVLYHMGDTDRIPEMKALDNLVNIGLVPIGGTFGMSAEEAAQAVKEFNPDIAVPMHYKMLLKGNASGQAVVFKKEVEKSGGTKVEIMDGG